MEERRIKAKAAANNIVVFTQATRMHEGGGIHYPGGLTETDGHRHCDLARRSLASAKSQVMQCTRCAVLADPVAGRRLQPAPKIGLYNQH